MQVTGTVNLIICDGITFNAEAGIIVPENATLIIFGQSNGSGKFKVDLNVDKHREFTDRALIGGDSSANGNPNSGDINIYGGNLDLKTHGFSTAAMIGGGQEAVNPAIDIYNGKVSASGIICYYNGAGIGSGRFANQNNPIRIHGGTVVATSLLKVSSQSGKQSTVWTDFFRLFQAA